MQETDKEEKEQTSTGLFCFLNSDRACGADCMAYEAAPTHKDFMGKQWANCMLLVNIHRTGKHLTIIAQSTDALLTLKRDEVRTQQPPPPAVR